MRAMMRAVLARHPAIAFAAVASRWLCWAGLGHPILVVFSCFGVAVFGLSPIEGVIVGVLSELLVDVVSAFGVRGWVSSCIGWRRACRFRRRWPSLSAEIGASSVRNVSAILIRDSSYSGPGGFRPILMSPRLSILPVALAGDRVCWKLRPTGRGSFETLAEQVDQVPLLDRRIERATLTRQLERSSPRWLLWIAFTTPNGAVPGDSLFEPIALGHPSDNTPGAAGGHDFDLWEGDQDDE